MKGRIFNIQRFSVNDGPGIRTTVFFKGCPLHCLWCHNPESGNRRPELLFDPAVCLSCGACAAVCRNQQMTPRAVLRENCTACGRCASVCPTGALARCGKDAEAEEILAEVRKDRAFYGEEGGLTLSGGEPLAQPEFALALLDGAKREGIGTCVETSGFADPAVVTSLLPVTDWFYFDWKVSDEEEHRKYTGVSNRPIMENLFLLDRAGARIVLRCPVIPTCNDTPAHFRGVAELANRLSHVVEIQVEPYHPLGRAKAERLGKPYPLSSLSFPSDREVEAWISAIRAETRVPVRRG